MLERNLKLTVRRYFQILVILLLACSASNSLAFSLGANQTINLRGNDLFSDSFDSNDPLHSNNRQYPAGMLTRTKANGDLCAGAGLIDSLGGGNVTVKGSIHTGAGTNTISIGPSGTVGDKSWVEGGSLGIEPGHFSTDFNSDFPSAQRPPGYWIPISPVNYTTNLWGTNNMTYKYVLTSDFTNWLINGNVSGSILIAAQSSAIVKLYITGNVNISGNDSITILPTGQQVRIYMTGTNFSLSGNAGIDNESGIAANFNLFGLPFCTNINFNGNGTFCGTVYAPQADFTFGGGGNTYYDVVGSIVARTVTMNGHFNFHFDEDLDRHPVFPPRILAQPQNQVALAGSPAAFSVTTQWATGLQWLLFGTNIIGATNTTLVLTNVTPLDAGLYSVLVSNSIYSATSSVASLTVYTTPAATLSAPVISTNGFQLTVTGVPGFQYAVETSTNLTDWLPLLTNIVPFDFGDPDAVNHTQRFYRSVWRP
jgi:hypothetical protein